MTERGWLALASHESLYGELAAVVQPRKLFLLGAAFLTGIEEWLPDAVRTAVVVTQEYAAGKTGVRDLLDAWINAEMATGDGLWSHEVRATYFNSCWCGGCDDCDASAAVDRKRVRKGVQEAIRDPGWFAARAAFLAVELASHDAPASQQEAIRLRVRQAQFPVLEDLLGDPLANPFSAPVPLVTNPPLMRLLSVIDRQEKFDSLTAFAVADALEEAGCQALEILSHFRGCPTHYRGCWAVERVAGREVMELPLDDAIIWPEDYRYRWRSWW